MRSLTAGQTSALQASVRDGGVHHRVRVKNADGTWVTLTSLSSYDWLDRIQYGETLDQPVPYADFTMWKFREGGDNLAPLDETSPLNVDDLGSYAALLDGGREIDWQTAVLAAGTSPGASDWETIFHGEIDEPEWGSEQVVVRARQYLMAHLWDRWIEEPTTYGGTQDVEDVMQDILTAETDGRVTLWVPTSPGLSVPDREMGPMRVWEALLQLAQMTGWDLRPRWNDSASEFQLKFFEPDRSASTTDWTFSTDDYFDVQRAGISRLNVRNAIDVKYTDSNGDRQTESVSDSTSITRFGRRWMGIFLQSDDPIDTSGEASTLANAALTDLKDPLLDYVVEADFFWPIELQDYYAFSASNTGDERWFSTAQNLAVYGYRHEVSVDRQRTVIQTRGKPAGQYVGWFPWGSDADEPPNEDGEDTDEITLTPTGTIAVKIADTGAASALGVGNARALSWKVAAATGSPPSDATVRAATPIDGRAFTEGDAGTLVTATPGQTVYLGAFAYDQTGGAGRESARLDDTETFGVTSDGIQDDSVITSKINDAAVEWAKIGDDAVRENNIIARGVAARHLFVGSFDNLVANPGFEQDGSELSGWTAVDGGATGWLVSTITQRSGAQSARYDPTGQTGAGELRSLDGGDGLSGFAVTEGDQVYAESYVRKQSTGTASDCRMDIRWLDESGAFVTQSSGTALTPTTSFQKISVTGTAPAGAVYGAVELVVLNGGGTENIFFDDVYARRMVEGSIVVDGTITADHLSVNTLDAVAADMGSLTAGSIVITTGSDKIWLNDGDDGSLHIGGSTKGSAPFSVDAAGAFTATSATITGTITAGSTIATGDLAASAITAVGTVTVEANSGGDSLVELVAFTGGRGAIYLRDETDTRSANWYVGASEVNFEATNGKDLGIYSAGDLTLSAGGSGDIHLDASSDHIRITSLTTATAPTGTTRWLELFVNGTEYHVQMREPT